MVPSVIPEREAEVNLEHAGYDWRNYKNSVIKDTPKHIFEIVAG